MRADFHIHTCYSPDSMTSPKQVVDAAIRKKIDCICICDHQETRGAAEAIHYAFSKPILVIPGIEVKSKNGDILGINVKKVIRNGLSVEETIAEITRQKGLAIVAHPFDKFLRFKKIRDYSDFFRKNGVGIEILNGSLYFQSSNEKAANFCDKNCLAFTAGSDAHNAHFIGRAYFDIPKENLSTEQVIEEIRNRNVTVNGENANFIEKTISYSKRCVAKVRHIVKA